MSNIKLVPCALLFAGIAFAKQSAQETPPRLDETVEDVETLRVLLTKELATKAVLSRGEGGFLTLGEAFDGRANNQFRNQQDADAKGAEAEPSDDADTEEGQAAPDARGAWIRTLTANGNLSLDPGVYTLGDLFAGPKNTSYTRAFYAPRIGAWIDTSVRVPLVLARDGARTETAKDKAVDDWAEAKRSLKGDAAEADLALGTPVVVSYRLSEEAIEKSIDGAVRVLQKHGHRVRHLAEDECVVIALKFEADAANAAMSTRYLTTSVDGAWRAAITAKSVKSATVILRAPKAILEAYQHGDIDEAAFRKRLAITRY